MSRLRMTPERIRQLEYASHYVANNPPKRCRCGGTCDYCSELKEQRRHVGPITQIELIEELKVARHIIANIRGGASQ